MRVLVNSLPKSGTNLLSGVVRQMGFTPFGAARGLFARAAARAGVAPPTSLTAETAGRSLAVRLRPARGRTPDVAAIPIGVTSPVHVPAPVLRGWLESVPAGCALTGHLPWSERGERLLADLGFGHVLIVRDPRDVLVSFLHYVRRGPHRLQADLEPLDRAAQIELVLRGGTGPRTGARVVGLVEGFRSVLAWRGSGSCLLVRFEDLVGEAGGGSAERQYGTVREIGEALDLALDHEAVIGICKRAFDTNARTFRRGRIGAFRDELSPEERFAVESALSPLLPELEELEPPR